MQASPSVESQTVFKPPGHSFLPVAYWYQGRYRLQGKKRVVDGVTGTIESDLKIIQKFVKAARDDIAHVGVIQVCRYPPQLLLRGISKRSRRVPEMARSDSSAALTQ